MLEIVEQRARRGVSGCRSGRSRCPRPARAGARRSAAARSASGTLWRCSNVADDRLAAHPGEDDQPDRARRSTSGTQPPSITRRMLAPKKIRSSVRNGRITASAQRARPVPAMPHDDIGEAGRDDHRAGHRDAVGRRHRRRGAELDHQHQHADQQQPVDRRQVDLPGIIGRGLADAQARQQPELDRLLGQRIGAGDHRLAGDDRRERRRGRPATGAATSGAIRKNQSSLANGCAARRRRLQLR